MPFAVGHEKLGRAARVQHSGVGLEEHRVEIVDAERRVQPLRVVRAEPLAAQTGGLERRTALGLEPVVAVREPRDADRLEQARLRLALEVEPQLPCPPGAARVPVDCAVRHSQQTGITARA